MAKGTSVQKHQEPTHQEPTPQVPSSLVPASRKQRRRLQRRRLQRRRSHGPRWRWGIGAGLSAIALALGYGAVQLRPFLKPFNEEISVAGLARFAEGAPLEGELAAYNAVPNIEQLRPWLTMPLSYNEPEVIPPLVASPEGQIVLERLGRLVQTHDGQNSAPVLAEALKQAAAEDDLTLLNVLQQFPEEKLRLNGQALWRTSWQVGRAWNRQRAAIARLDRQFHRQRSASRLSFPGAPELLRKGTSISRLTWVVDDQARQRPIWLDLYLPEIPPETSAPTIVISHGLTANRRTFSYLAQQLASHGFLVVAVEHPDSNGEAHRAFLAGESSALMPPETLLERPRDISFALDALEKAGLDGWFDLNRVGIIGHSLGGNTALAIAGARIDRTQLSEMCTDASESLNPSLVFAQCPLLQLPEHQTAQDLRDERITSVLAISPVASQVFSKASLQQLSVPLLMVASDQDWITPAAEEQIVPFQRVRSPGSLKAALPLASASASLSSEASPPTYLALLRGGAHWTTMGGKSCLLPGPRQELAKSAGAGLGSSRRAGDRAQRPVHLSHRLQPSHPSIKKAIARDYLCSLGTAFFKTTLTGVTLDPYLSADYAAVISQPQLPLVFVEARTSRSLGAAATELTRVTRRRQSKKTTSGSEMPSSPELPANQP